jgi:hypothetical protein
MSKFSSRYGYDPKSPREPILEDAPQWVRNPYLSQILNSLTYVDDTRWSNEEGRPLEVKRLYEDLCRISRQEPDEIAYDTWQSWQTLEASLKGIDWYYFYDFVEHVGQRLKHLEGSSLRADDWNRDYGFEQYQRKVNQLFNDERIGWKLNDRAELARERPKHLSKALETTEQTLRDSFSPAREHYRKAVRYIYDRPTDPENAIKEIISAIESIGRVYYAPANTLGDVVKEMKKDKRFPPMLVSTIEKFYGFASSEPAVRHGAATPSRVLLMDAEFCLHVGVALIRYLTQKHGHVS